VEIEDKIIAILDDFGTELVTDLIQSLRNKKVTGSGGQDSNLAGSIRFRLLEEKGTIGIEVLMNDYWEAVEEGRSPGKQPPVSKIVAWLKWKGIVPKFSDRVKAKAKTLKNKTVRKGFKERAIDKKLQSLAFAIAKTIGKKGTIKRFGYQGSDFVKSVLNDGRLGQLEQAVLEQTGLVIEVQLAEALTA
jgi:hypothetical protein